MTATGEQYEAVPSPTAGCPLGPAPWGEHRQELLARVRCCHCAEPVPPLVILRALPCPKCRRAVLLEAGSGGLELIRKLSERWASWRWVIYPLVTVAALLSGWVPLVPALLRVAGLVLVNILLVARPLRWLSPQRRIATQLTLRLALLSLAVSAWAIDTVVCVIPGVNLLVSALMTLAGTVLYAELALALVRGRLQRELVTTSIGTWEWLLPLGMVGVLTGAVAGAVLAIGAFLYFLKQVQVPLVTSLIGWIL